MVTNGICRIFGTFPKIGHNGLLCFRCLLVCLSSVIGEEWPRLQARYYSSTVVPKNQTIYELLEPTPMLLHTKNNVGSYRIIYHNSNRRAFYILWCRLCTKWWGWRWSSLWTDKGFSIPKIYPRIELKIQLNRSPEFYRKGLG